MHPRKTALRIAGAVFALMVLFLLATVLYHFRPLLRTTDYSATVETPGAGRASASVYTMVGMPQWVFVKIPPNHRDRERPYDCFLWDTRRQVVLMSSMQDSPYLHRRHDQAIGINLLSGKMEDNWRMEHSLQRVRFTNDRQTVTVERLAP